MPSLIKSIFFLFAQLNTSRQGVKLPCKFWCACFCCRKGLLLKAACVLEYSIQRLPGYVPVVGTRTTKTNNGPPVDPVSDTLSALRSLFSQDFTWFGFGPKHKISLRGGTGASNGGRVLYEGNGRLFSASILRCSRPEYNVQRVNYVLTFLFCLFRFPYT